MKISKKWYFWTPFETFLLRMDLLLQLRLLPPKQSLRGAWDNKLRILIRSDFQGILLWTLLSNKPVSLRTFNCCLGKLLSWVPEVEQIFETWYILSTQSWALFWVKPKLSTLNWALFVILRYLSTLSWALFQFCHYLSTHIWALFKCWFLIWALFFAENARSEQKKTLWVGPLFAVWGV